MPALKIKLKYKETDWIDSYLLDVENEIYRHILYNLDHPDEIEKNAGFEIVRMWLPIWIVLGPHEDKVMAIQEKLTDDSQLREKQVMKTLNLLKKRIPK